MTVSTTTLTVGTVDLRQALTAVKEHACKDADFPDIARVRLTIGSRHVFVTASDQSTCGLAVVSTWDHDGADTEIVELLVEDVDKLLRVFKTAGKDASDEGPQYMLKLDIDDVEITITDVSGFGIVGHKLHIPRLETAVTLDAVPTMFRQAHSGQVVLLDETTRMLVSGKNLGRFKVAAATYADTLTLETRGGSTHRTALILVRCGESFLGLVVPRMPMEGEVERAREWAEGWTARLPEIAVVGGAE